MRCLSHPACRYVRITFRVDYIARSQQRRYAHTTSRVTQVNVPCGSNGHIKLKSVHSVD